MLRKPYWWLLMILDLPLEDHSTHARSINAWLSSVTYTTRMRNAVGVSGGVAGVRQRGGAKVGVWLSWYWLSSSSSSSSPETCSCQDTRSSVLWTRRDRLGKWTRLTRRASLSAVLKQWVRSQSCGFHKRDDNDYRRIERESVRERERSSTITATHSTGSKPMIGSPFSLADKAARTHYVMHW